MTRTPHILILPTWYPNSRREDYAVFFRVQTKALRAAGAQVGVIFPELREPSDWSGMAALGENRFQISEAAPDGYPVIRWHGWRVPAFHEMSAMMFARAAQRLYRLYEKRHGRPDIVLAHAAINGGWAAHRLKGIAGLPYVLVEHSTHFARGLYTPRALARATTSFEDAAAVFAVSDPFARSLEKQFGIPVQYAPNSIDTTFFSPGDTPPEPLVGRSLRLGFVGTLDDKKGVDILLLALARLSPDCPIELQLIGEGSGRPRYEAQVAELGLGDRVRFLGPQRQTAVRDLMRRSDLFVLPSRFETFGVVVIEALASGTPVVATRCGGPESIITDLSQGVLVPPEDPDAFADAIEVQATRLARWTLADAQALNAGVEDRFGALSCARRFIETLRHHLDQKD